MGHWWGLFLIALTISCATAFVFWAGYVDLDANDDYVNTLEHEAALTQQQIDKQLRQYPQDEDLDPEEISRRRGSDIRSVLEEFAGTELDGDLGAYAATL